MARDVSEDAITAYKAILSAIIDNRPSGTRQRLAAALGKHRSFVTQITSPGYATPLPARHLATIFQVCHVSKAEQDRFLEAYQVAHPGKLPDLGHAGGLRQLTLMVADFGDERKNRMLDEAVQDFIQRIVLLSGEGD
ncbi:hypothetical protein [Pararhizobium sp. LjRoot238]|uniref:hypothetical protein n=1 Tax=Pararhizobium sp. LjRoot238 TaxID=3342293 RepID=UPI003ECD4362